MESQVAVTQGNTDAEIILTNLPSDITMLSLYYQFISFGVLKQVNLNRKENIATIVYADTECAKKAISSSSFGSSKNIKNMQSDATGKFKVFLTCLPEELDQTLLRSYLESTYGEIVQLSVHEDEFKKKLGVGYLLFKHRSSFDQILQDQKRDGKIVVPNSQIQFCAGQFKEQNEQNKDILSVFVKNFFEEAIESTQIEEKLEQINTVLSKLKQHLLSTPSLGCTLFYFLAQYNPMKLNVSADIRFRFTDEDSEDSILLKIKATIQEHFMYSNGAYPIITYSSYTTNERNILLRGIKEDIKDTDIQLWLQIYFKKNLQLERICIEGDLPKYGRKAIINFDTRLDGEALLIFACKVGSRGTMQQILKNHQKVTLYLNDKQMKEMQQKQNSFRQYQQKYRR